MGVCPSLTMVSLGQEWTCIHRRIAYNCQLNKWQTTKSDLVHLNIGYWKLVEQKLIHRQIKYLCLKSGSQVSGTEQLQILICWYTAVETLYV